MSNRPEPYVTRRGPTSAALVAARNHMIDELRARGVTDEAVLHAIASVPREEFVPPSFRHRAYEDDALPIECSQTISQPFTVGMMSQLLDARPGMKVLEIGTGSGYQAAVLFRLGLRVFSVERHAPLLRQAAERLRMIDCNIALHCGDGTLGWREYAPYDGIIVTAGAKEIPSALLKQLAPNGRLVIPVGGRDSQQMQIVVRHGDSNEYDVFEHGTFKFVPLIGVNGWRVDELPAEGPGRSSRSGPYR